jgi:hypothetical protein
MIEKTLHITTIAGEMETFICHPERNGSSPAIFFLAMDATVSVRSLRISRAARQRSRQQQSYSRR